VCLIKSFELLRAQQLSIMQQIRASVFYMVVHWHKLGEVNECSSHNSIILAICVPKSSKFGRDLTKFWKKTSWDIFGPPCTL